MIEEIIELRGILSHDADFIRMLRDRGFDRVLLLRRSGVYCVIEECDIDAVCEMDYVEHEPEFEPLLNTGPDKVFDFGRRVDAARPRGARSL